MMEPQPGDIIVVSRKDLQMLVYGSSALAALAAMKDRQDLSKILTPGELAGLQNASYVLHQLIEAELKQPATKGAEGEEGDTGPLAIDHDVHETTTSGMGTPTMAGPSLQGYS